MKRPSRPSNSTRSAGPTPAASACRMKGSKSPAARASAKVGSKGVRSMGSLVMVEWEDSAQPIPAWSYLASFEAPGIIRCASVGWLVRDDEEMKVVAPNMGGLDCESSVQISGAIQIPTRCVLRVTQLKEPVLTSRP